MTEFKTEKIHIIFPGDPSVGIFPARFELGPDLVFESKREADQFMIMLARLFESYLTGYPCYCQTEEDFQAMEKQIEDGYKKNQGSEPDNADQGKPSD